MDSGVIAFLLFLEYMGQFECSAQAVREKFTKYSAIEETNFRVRNVAEVLNFLSDRYKDGYQEHQDGMFVSYEDWWFSVRPSSGEPLIRVNIEATSSELLREKAEEILSQIPQFHV